jgi:murein DD-endopeptidase MepM/ murein hydrolase activator NlpD
MAKINKSKNPERKWYYRLRDKYNLIILNQSTYEEKLNVRLSRLNVFVFIILLALILVSITTYIIAFTPLREYIPGYTDVNLRKDLYEISVKADSMSMVVEQQNQYISALQLILTGQDEFVDSNQYEVKNKDINYDDIELQRSVEDSLLRAEYEAQDEYNIRIFTEKLDKSTSIANYAFIAPLKGIISNEYNPKAEHMGVDIVSDKNEPIKATLDGTVIFAIWTIQTGHVMMIQHTQNLISVYKHNAVLLKKIGDVVKGGDPIAIVGDSGELSTGPHLHFELWYNGSPVDPTMYMVF